MLKDKIDISNRKNTDQVINLNKRSPCYHTHSITEDLDRNLNKNINSIAATNDTGQMESALNHFTHIVLKLKVC